MAFSRQSMKIHRISKNNTNAITQNTQDIQNSVTSISNLITSFNGMQTDVSNIQDQVLVLYDKLNKTCSSLSDYRSPTDWLGILSWADPLERLVFDTSGSFFCVPASLVQAYGRVLLKDRVPPSSSKQSAVYEPSGIICFWLWGALVFPMPWQIIHQIAVSSYLGDFLWWLYG